MTEFQVQALSKLADGVKAVKERIGKAMAPAISAYLSDFCRQDAEFAQAVAQGGDFPACMGAVAQGVGSSISDLDAVKKAVNFYFPGAEVSFKMSIRLGPDNDPPAPDTGPKLLDLADFL